MRWATSDEMALGMEADETMAGKPREDKDADDNNTLRSVRKRKNWFGGEVDKRRGSKIRTVNVAGSH